MAPTVTPQPAAPRRPRALPWDLAGLGIVVALGGWTLVASADRPFARPGPVLVLLGCATLLFVAARVAARYEDLLPRVVAVAIAGAFVLTLPGVLKAGGAPTGYGNTNGTLAGLGGIAAATVALSSREAPARRGWFAIAAAMAVFVGLSESVAAAAALSVAVALAVVALLRRDATVAALGGLLATWLAIGATTALADGAGDDLSDRGQALRLELWGRALDFARDAPLRGRGPGSFSPPIAFFDADLRWAHHEYLQQAAEVGVVGLVLLLVLIAWLFAYLWWGRRRGLVRTITGASAVTLVALHATVDHVLHTAVVPLTLAALVGWATADRRDPGSRGSPHPRR